MLKIKTDSRKIVSGDTFVAIRGINSDGHQYIEQAIAKGATNIVAEEGSYSVPTLIVPDTKLYLAQYLKDKTKEQLKDVKFIGITGTNGKTTTCYLIYKLLNMLRSNSAYIGTIGYYLNNEKFELNNTTPEIVDLYEMFVESATQGAKNIVMEVSSHALELGQVEGLTFDAAGYTNLTKEHLDFHQNMGNYLQAKQKLFKQIKPNGFAVINGDDEFANDFIMPHNTNYTVGEAENNTYQIIDYQLDIDKTTFTFAYQSNNYQVTINLPGKYNIHNFMMALITVQQMGYDINDILDKAVVLEAPPGRMDSITYNDASIIVDYAHTPDAVLNVLTTAQACAQGKIYTIVGCGGNRDKTKRPIMGDIATKMSDYVIFTNDNPRFEDEKAIMADITNGLAQSNYEVIYDRKKAINKAISLLQPQDMLLILGKGHEKYQIVGDEHLIHDDKAVVEDCIKKNTHSLNLTKI
ncbi:MAG TPA: UDP-N-acetylmuramoyl-L-alanyl-D-glutamate--2,6-diaminopimelate ligase [Bacilli bacterium]|nr:UDP-N-acetylmuramoyl-L-alanyl-D-glutamate--2,6-diaminopimelate ligase [Bacilli bacterium]